MSRSDEERIADIIEAGGQIAGIVSVGKAAWDGDRVAQLAVERLLEIIGESARATSEESRAQHPDVAWSDVIGLRVVLAHPLPPSRSGSGLGPRLNRGSKAHRPAVLTTSCLSNRSRMDDLST